MALFTFLIFGRRAINNKQTKTGQVKTVAINIKYPP